MLSEPNVRDIIAAWRAVWDPFVEPQPSVWCKALARAGMTDENAVDLNDAFLAWWTGSTAPKLGHLLSWLRNRVPSQGWQAKPPPPLTKAQDQKIADNLRALRDRLKGGA